MLGRLEMVYGQSGIARTSVPCEGTAELADPAVRVPGPIAEKEVHQHYLTYPRRHVRTTGEKCAREHRDER